MPGVFVSSSINWFTIVSLPLLSTSHLRPLRVCSEFWCASTVTYGFPAGSASPVGGIAAASLAHGELRSLAIAVRRNRAGQTSLVTSEEFQAWQETFPRYTSIKRGPAVTRDPPHLTSNISNIFLCTFLFRSLYLDSFLLRSFVSRSFISRILFRCLSFDPVQSTLDNLVPHRLAQSLILAKEIKIGAKIPQPRRISALISLEIAINVFGEVSPPLRISVSMNVFSLYDLSQLTSAFAQPLSMSSATTRVHKVLTRQ
jgi:hypothetical protein